MIIEYQSLNSVFESVRGIFAANSQQIMDRQVKIKITKEKNRIMFEQKGIVDYVNKTKEHSNIILSHYLQKNTNFARLRHDEMEKKILEIKFIEQESHKVKHYLLMLIKRLEDLEEKVDNLTAIKAHKKPPYADQPKELHSNSTTLDEEVKEQGIFIEGIIFVRIKEVNKKGRFY